jgi:hypothetical protein
MLPEVPATKEREGGGGLAAGHPRERMQIADVGSCRKPPADRVPEAVGEGTAERNVRGVLVRGGADGADVLLGEDDLLPPQSRAALNPRLDKQPPEELDARRSETVTTQKNPQYYNCLLFSFSHHYDVMHLHASYHLAYFFLKLKIIWYKTYFYFSCMVYKNPPFPFLSWIKTKTILFANF